MTSNSPPPPRGRKDRALGLLPALMLAAWVVYVLRHYDIRAGSDPLNWLEFARNLGAEFSTSRFAGGFAVFLAGALALLGPFRVFLVNLPVFLGLFVLAAALAGRAFAPEERAPRWQVATAVLALFLGFDRPLVLNMVNPYRDPLALLLALGSLNLVAGLAAGGGRSLFRTALAGLLLGLACFVRETFVLLLPPLALFAWWSRRADPRFRFWRAALGFGLGFGLGIGPLLVQGWLSTGQALVPHQSAMTGQLVPGAHFNWSTLSVTAGRTWDYVRDTAGFVLALFAAGGILGLRRRNRLVAGLLLPAVLIHAVFYCFYWTFVPRYFYTGVVLAVPAAAWAALALFRQAAARLCPRRPETAATVGLALLAAGVAASLLFARPDSPRFQIPQARRFAADMRRILPENSLVFCRRPLCEILRWFVPVRSFPLAALIPADVPAEPALREALAPHVPGNAPAFLLDVGRTTDAALLQRLCGLDTRADVSLEAYQLQHWAGKAQARLHAVRAWTPDPLEPPGIEDARRGYARLDFGLDALPAALPLLEGANVSEPTLGRPVPRLLAPAAVRLPGPLASNEFAAAEIRLRSPERAAGDMDVAVSFGGLRHPIRLPKDREWHVFAFPALRAANPPALRIEAPGALDLHWVDWYVFPPSARLEIDAGGPLDSAFLLDGWHGREKDDGVRVRWTGATATVFWACAAPGEPARLTVHHRSRHRPGSFAVRLFCHDVQIHAGRVDAPAPETAPLVADIPAALVGTTNLLRIEADGWAPGGRDPRTLGLLVDRIILESAAP